MRIKKCEKKILEDNFKLYYSDDNKYIELEQWTNGGVDMIIDIDLTSKDSLVEQLETYIDNFDIDEEIDLYRESKDYRQHFTIRQSLYDFEDWLDWLQNIIKSLKVAK